MKAFFRKYLLQHGYPEFELKAVLFDMDGVLYDSMPAHAKSWQQTMEEFGFTSTTPGEFYLHEGRTGKSTINIVFQREYGREASDDEVQKIYNRKTELFYTYNTGHTIEGAKEMLDMVKAEGLLPILVTGSGQPSLLDKLNDNFPGIFTPETMVTGHDVAIGKPHPEPFLKGLEKGEGLRPNQAIVVENAPLGVTAAHAAGIFTVCANTGPLADEVLKDAGADIVFDNVHALNEKLPEIFQMTKTMHA